MKGINLTHAKALVVSLAAATLMLSGTAFAGSPGPEIDPGMATGGLTILGVGVFLLIERYRARS